MHHERIHNEEACVPRDVWEKMCRIVGQKDMTIESLLAQRNELEERANKLHRLYNDAQDNASKEAERRVELEQENGRLQMTVAENVSQAVRDLEQENERLREENERMAEDYERGQIETDYGNYVSVALYGQALNENERLEKCWQRDSAKLDLAEQEIERLLRLVETVDRQRIANGDEVERLRAGQRNDGDLIEGLRQEVKQLRKDREDDLLQHATIMQKQRHEVEQLRAQADKDGTERYVMNEKVWVLKKENERLRKALERALELGEQNLAEVERLRMVIESQEVAAPYGPKWRELVAENERLRAEVDVLRKMTEAL
jgi:frataxin-like iron-binding protein CyaY